jgi:hypothetical protein
MPGKAREMRLKAREEKHGLVGLTLALERAPRAGVFQMEDGSVISRADAELLVKWMAEEELRDKCAKG